MIPIPNKTAKTVANAVVTEVFCRHGIPESILTDKGLEFDSSAMLVLATELGIDKKRISALHPQANGAVERLNRTIGQMLKTTQEENDLDWDLKIPFVRFNYLNQEHSSTGYSPFYLTFGRNTRTPVLVKDSSMPKPKTPQQWATDLAKTLKEAHDASSTRDRLQKEKGQKRARRFLLHKGSRLGMRFIRHHDQLRYLHSRPLHLTKPSQADVTDDKPVHDIQPSGVPKKPTTSTNTVPPLTSLPTFGDSDDESDEDSDNGEGYKNPSQELTDLGKDITSEDECSEEDIESDSECDELDISEDEYKYDNEDSDDPDWVGLENEAADNDSWNDEEHNSRNNIRLITTPLRQEQCTRVDIVFDRYDLPHSIKESERLKRESSNALEIKITTRSTPVPKQWQQFISNKRNKVNLCAFLCQEWCEMAKSAMRHGQELVIGGGFDDPTNTVIISNGRTSILEGLKSDHEEADTRMLLHACHASSTKPRIVIQSPDTDVAVLAIHFFCHIQCEELWFKTGVKDKVRFLPVHIVVDKLGLSVCSALLGFHALTGCDFTSGLSQIGNKKSWNALMKREDAQDHVGNLGTRISPSDHTSQACENFICSLYTTTKKAGTTGDEVRYWMFCQKHQSSEKLPPTSNSLSHHIERANYQVFVWKHSLQAIQKLPSPVDSGWQEGDGSLEPILMSRDPAPRTLFELTICSCSKSLCKRNMCTCNANNMPCTEAWLCMSDERCQNPHKATEPAIESGEDEVTDDED
ncbi:hypothetical protein QZH41_007178 [Actinostola sp. cb2023]|nr:hypothetical protein QZH41_007178 [Actinostola sp. cb2023]